MQGRIAHGSAFDRHFFRKDASMMFPYCSGFRTSRQTIFLLFFLGCWMAGATLSLLAADSVGSPAATTSPSSTNALAAAENHLSPRFNITGYTVEGNPLLSTNVLVAVFSKYAGPDVTLEEIVKAAADLQLAYRNQGYPAMSVAVVPGQITNGIVTMNVFQAVIPQIVVAGRRYPTLGPGLEIAAATNPVVNPLPAGPVLAQQSAAAPPAATTNAVPVIIFHPTEPASAEEIAHARATLLQTMADNKARENDTRVHVVSTNAGPRFEVEKYLVIGNSVLPPKAISEVLTNIDGAFGTNVSFEGIRTVLAELQAAYHERGYVTVTLGLPQQKLTNATVKVQVTEGRLADINVKGNRYFSSNNVMRALPSLHTNTVLNGPIFQAELNRANANQDRQIYPVISPGPDPGTSDLTLRVKDQLPLHAKVDYNNESSPGTPDTRINTSAVYNNLFDLDQSAGAQYSFSPQQYKNGNWPFYDEPLVATYGMFYRVPLGNPAPIENEVANSPGSFGYDEATHKFNLPSPTGQPDFTAFASRSTIDTGLESLSTQTLTPPGAKLTITQQNEQQSVTVNQDIGGRLSVPFVTPDNMLVNFSGGLDFKTYQVGNYKTNIFTFIQQQVDAAGNPLPPLISTVNSPVPATTQQIQYLPLSLRSDVSERDFAGSSTFGLGLSFNPWFTSQTYKTSSSTDTNHVTTTTTTKTYGYESLQGITGSPESTGYWVVLSPTFTRTFMFYTNWPTSFRADGQWASQPLISNEQFGIGGVNSVRGYHEGEEFGDTGWHFSLEQSTPPHTVGTVFGNTPLTLRGSVYMDIATVYLLDPQGRSASTELWGTGFGFTAAVGSHWAARFLFSVPLIGTSYTTQDQPYFNFGLTAQF
jgi:hemolysin activation/secretion protein